MPKVNKIKLLSERTSGAPPVIFIFEISIQFQRVSPLKAENLYFCTFLVWERVPTTDSDFQIFLYHVCYHKSNVSRPSGVPTSCILLEEGDCCLESVCFSLIISLFKLVFPCLFIWFLISIFCCPQTALLVTLSLSE